MKSKYYTPKLEEFRVGFEYEVFQKGEKTSPEMMSFMPIETEDKWYKYSWPDPFFGYHLDRLLKREIRVKYLDRSDIESCGFEKCELEFWSIMSINHCAFKKDYLDNRFRSIEVGDDEVCISQKSNDETRSANLFSGKIKNLSELKMILEMLNIDYEKI